MAKKYSQLFCHRNICFEGGGFIVDMTISIERKHCVEKSQKNNNNNNKERHICDGHLKEKGHTIIILLLIYRLWFTQLRALTELANTLLKNVFEQKFLRSFINFFCFLYTQFSRKASRK